MNNQAINRRLW